MRQDKLSKQNVILYLCGIIPVVWLGLLIAPCLKDGLPGLVQQFGSVPIPDNEAGSVCPQDAVKI